jgi:hypothetical protein
VISQLMSINIGATSEADRLLRVVIQSSALAEQVVADLHLSKTRMVDRMGGTEEAPASGT